MNCASHRETAIATITKRINDLDLKFGVKPRELFVDPELFEELLSELSSMKMLRLDETHQGVRFDGVSIKRDWSMNSASQREQPQALSVQVGGAHYKDFVIQPVEFITRNKLGFLEGCVIKRICRFRAKNGREDLEKIKHEIDLLIELEYGRQA